MDNKALLWAKPDKAGILLKRGGEIKTWKKRQFVLKDSYLFYFKVLASVEQSDPTGVIPLQGCKVGIAYVQPNSSVQNIFVITLPEELAGLGILKRTNYVLAAQDFEDMQSWIDAMRLASLSKRKLQAKVDHAYMEVRDLEKRWAVAKERDAYREAGRGAPPLQSQGGEDPILLQALADMLMEAYHMRDLLQTTEHTAVAVTSFAHVASTTTALPSRNVPIANVPTIISGGVSLPSHNVMDSQRFKEAHVRSQEASTHLTVLERAASIQEEKVMAREDMGYAMSDIQAEMAACSQSLEWLIPARFQYYSIERQVEALEGLHEGGEGVPSANEIEAILRETLRRLEDLEFQNRGDEALPDEGIMAELRTQMASIYAEYMAILQRASESLQSSSRNVAASSQPRFPGYQGSA
ncbi:hypothetical protein L7F22_032469 [Adiantum nelumboides]|nr:hypothetical protein [Adiantum nelumboides]